MEAMGRGRPQKLERDDFGLVSHDQSHGQNHERPRGSAWRPGAHELCAVVHDGVFLEVKFVEGLQVLVVAAALAVTSGAVARLLHEPEQPLHEPSRLVRGLLEIELEELRDSVAVAGLFGAEPGVERFVALVDSHSVAAEVPPIDHS